MLEKKYVAIADFNLNMDNGKVSVPIKRGMDLLFDGLHATVGSDRGQARNLIKTIGVWMVESEDGVDSEDQIESVSSQDEKPRDVAGKDSIEESTPYGLDEVGAVSAGRDPALEELVRKYETTSGRKIRIIEDDDNVVAKVRNVDGDSKKNTSGVQIEDKVESKRPIVYNEERVAKVTNYSKKETPKEADTHLKVERDGEGVEVRKVSKAKPVSKKAASTKTVSREHTVVKKTEAIKTKPVDIGSSTKAQVLDKVVLPPMTPEEKQAALDRMGGRRANILTAENQDGEVVGKVKNTNMNIKSEGISIKTIVRSPDNDTNEGVIFSKVTPSGAVDGEIETDGVIMSRRGATVSDTDSGDVIDVSELLDNV